MKKMLIFSLFAFVVAGFAFSQTITVTSPTGGTFPVNSGLGIGWTTTGISSGNVRVLLINNNDRSYRQTIEQSVAYNSPPLKYHIPGDTPEGTYFVQIRLIGQQVSGSSPTFTISSALPTFKAVPFRLREIRINLPARGQQFALGNRVVVEWLMPEADICGERVSLYAKRVSTGEEYRIAENPSCQPGKNTYDWYVSTPFYYEITGDYRLKIVSNTGCQKESEVFQILRRDDMTASGCDYSIDSVVFSDGRSLDQGLGIAPGQELRDTFLVSVKWNRSRPPQRGSHRVEVSSVLTKETVHTSNQPAQFSYEDANASTGIIRINVPFAIPANKVLAMKRGRFIPLKCSLIINPASCDTLSHNNSRDMNMRVIDTVPSGDLVIEIVPNSLKVARYNVGKTNVDFEVQVRVRNLSRNDAGGPPSPLKDVKCSWRIDIPQKGHYSNDFTLPTVGSSWVVYKLETGMNIDRNWWIPLNFTVTVDKDKQFLDPNRSNNTASQEFTVPE
jgi:hypothetical protein